MSQGDLFKKGILAGNLRCNRETPLSNFPYHYWSTSSIWSIYIRRITFLYSVKMSYLSFWEWQIKISFPTKAYFLDQIYSPIFSELSGVSLILEFEKHGNTDNFYFKLGLYAYEFLLLEYDTNMTCNPDYSSHLAWTCFLLNLFLETAWQHNFRLILRDLSTPAFTENPKSLQSTEYF